MKHVDILVNVLTLLSGLMTALLGFLLYMKYKIKEIRYYSFFILTTTFTVTFTSIYSYLTFYTSIIAHPLLQMSAFLLFEIFIILINYAFSMFALGIISKRFSLFNKIIVGLPILLVFASIITPFVYSKAYPILSGCFMVILLSLFITLVYSSIQIAINLKNIQNQDLKKALKLLALLLIVFIPLQSIIVAYNKQWMVIMLSRNMLYLMINIVSIVYAAKYFFAESPSILEHIEIDEHFIKKYSITNREKEIMELLLSGLSIKEISAKLDRSFKTVNNHIYNIYKKTDVSSKMELLNLLKQQHLG